jgi:hypothetical protein
VKRQRRHRRVTFEDETASLANSMTKNLPNMSLQRSIELSSMSKSCTAYMSEVARTTVYFCVSVHRVRTKRRVRAISVLSHRFYDYRKFLSAARCSLVSIK